MLPSIQSANTTVARGELRDTDPTRLIYQFLYAFASSQPSFETRLAQMENLALAIREILGLLTLLSARQQQTGVAPTAADIKAAINEGKPITGLFSSDPENLGSDLNQATELRLALENAGIAVEATLAYPVIVISSEKDREDRVELIWMNEGERLALDRFPASGNDDDGPYLSRVNSTGSNSTRYVLLDDCVNLRIGPEDLANMISREDQLLAYNADQIASVRSSLSIELESNADFLAFMERAIKSRLECESKNMDKKEELDAESANIDRESTLRWGLLKAALVQLEKQKTIADQLSEEIK